MQVAEAIVALLMIVLIFFLAWFIPHLLAGNNLLGLRGSHISVVERTQVAKDSYIVIVKMFDKLLVLGVTPGGMTTLGSLNAENMDIDTGGAPAPGFAQVLRDALGSTLNGMKNKKEQFRKGEQRR